MQHSSTARPPKPVADPEYRDALRKQQKQEDREYRQIREAYRRTTAPVDPFDF